MNFNVRSSLKKTAIIKPMLLSFFFFLFLFLFLRIIRIYIMFLFVLWHKKLIIFKSIVTLDLESDKDGNLTSLGVERERVMLMS